METCYIGVDIGTTSTKSVVFTLDGVEIFKHSVEYPLYTSIDGKAEQNPEEIFQAVVHTLQACIKEATRHPFFIRAISFSSAMHSLLIVDKNGKPLTNVMTWADTRSAKWAKELKANLHSQDLYQKTGTPIHAMTPFSKLLWIKDEKPHLLKHGDKIISIKEYVIYKLFGEYVVDYSVACATGLMNMHTLTWDDEAMSFIGLDHRKLSNIVPTTYQLPPMKKAYRQLLGLTKEPCYIIGASDGVLSNLGLNAIHKDVVALTVGTSGAIRTVVQKPTTDERGRTFCYPLTKEHWVIGGPVNNGGIILRWVKELFDVDYERLNLLAKQAPPGSNGLLFHPYLTGERAPIWNADAKGSFFGLTLNHRKSHMIRAVMEGVVYNLASVMHMLKPFAEHPKLIRASGGFAQSSLWCQIVADIFGVPVEIPNSIESSCLGAVLLSAYALGDVSSLKESIPHMGDVTRFHPNMEHVKIYKALYPLYEKLLHQFEPLYTEQELMM